jgi:hypothetical protein
MYGQELKYLWIKKCYDNGNNNEGEQTVILRLQRGVTRIVLRSNVRNLLQCCINTG